MIEEIVKITGEINISDSIHCTLGGVEELSADVTIPQIVRPSAYEGPYTVMPEFAPQILETDGLYMVEDVTVRAIQVSRTSNPSGGTTVYIGGLIDG